MAVPLRGRRPACAAWRAARWHQHGQFPARHRQDAGGRPGRRLPRHGARDRRRLGVPCKLVPYARPSDLADDAGKDTWDIGNIGAEPQRAEKIAFTAAYCEIEATYLVPPGSPITAMDQVDVAGNRIYTGAGAAYTLWLERNIKSAKLVLVPGGGGAAFQEFLDDKAEVYGGLRPGLITDIEKIARRAHPGWPVHGGAAGDRHGTAEHRRRGLACCLRRGGEGQRPGRRADREAQGARPLGRTGGLNPGSALQQPARRRRPRALVVEQLRARARAPPATASTDRPRGRRRPPCRAARAGRAPSSVEPALEVRELVDVLALRLPVDRPRVARSCRRSCTRRRRGSGGRRGGCSARRRAGSPRR